MYLPTDLHGHTYLSDGRATPEEYVDFRREIGMRAIAIADHDILAGVRRGAAAAAAAGLIFIPALEVTAFLHHGTPEAEQFHVLAYFPASAVAGHGLEQTALYQRGLLVQERWRDLVLEWLAALEPADREALDGEGELSSKAAPFFPALQSTILHILERKPDLFDRFQKHHAVFWNGDQNRDLFAWTPEEAIDFIRSDGALDIVAHPVRYRDRARTDAILDYASGLEVYTSRHKPEVAAAFRAHAEAKRKLWTSSSDDHQNARYERPPCGTPVATLERLGLKTLPLSAYLVA